MQKNGTVDSKIMTHHQLQTELVRCEYCEEKPCKEACPVNCSPFDFMMAARVGNPSDIKRAAAEIMLSNPLGGVWEEGVVTGMSGDGVTPISYLTLANAVPEGIKISGNGGPMTYKAAMDFLALGVKTVQFCTIATKFGYGIIRDLESGTAFLMQERGISSMKELIGIAQPHPITDFMALSSVKKISDFNYNLCTSCGNCARCPYLAIELDEQGRPHSDPARCIGCSICAKKCFTGAISLRQRTAEELVMLVEN